MFSRPNSRVRSVLLCFILAGSALFPYSGASGSTLPSGGQPAKLESNKYFTVTTEALPDGNAIYRAAINGPPTPPPGFEAERQAVSLPEPDIAQGINILSVPAFNWVYGCAAVSGAMIAGYYDRTGFPNIYTGPTNGSVMPLDNSSWPTWSDGYSLYPNCPLIATKNGVDGRTSRGSIDDYWVKAWSNTQDPYLTGGWTQHAWGDAIGDYMKTSQSTYNIGDGTTLFYFFGGPGRTTCDTIDSNSWPDGTVGRKHFYEARDYSVKDCYIQLTDNKESGGFSFTQFKAEIDAGHPVMLNLEGHTIVGVGYNDSTNTVYIHDTWDHYTHTMQWGGSYSGMTLWSASIVHIVPRMPKLTVNVDTSGTVSAEGLSCTWYACTGSYDKGTMVTITPKANSGNYFNGWTNCPSESYDHKCIVTMDDDMELTADFMWNPVLTVTIGGNKQGTVSADGLDCSGDTCTGRYEKGAKVKITPKAASGAFFNGWTNCSSQSSDHTCIVTMNAGTELTANFSLPPKITVAPMSINFGSVKATNESLKSVKITNKGVAGGGNLTVGTMSFAGTDHADFSIKDTNCTVPLARGSSCTASVKISSSTFGKKTATLVVPSDDPNKPTVSAKLAATVMPPNISVSPSSLNFGKIKTGNATATKVVTIKNNGLSDLDSISLSLSGDIAPSIQSNTCGTSLAKGVSCKVSIAVSPASTGPKTGVLNISSNDPKKPTVPVKLKGTATSP